MCYTCLRSPCDARCPNAPEPPAALWCDKCGGPIRAGEEYYEKQDGSALCMDCVECICAADLLEHFGCALKCAERGGL